MAGVENLKPIQSTEEARERGRKGGIASGKARREKRMMKETIESLLTMSMKSGKGTNIEDIKNFADIKGKNISVQDAILIAQLQKALKGDTRAAEYIRDTIGQKPTDNMNLNMELPVFFDGEDDLEE